MRQLSVLALLAALLLLGACPSRDTTDKPGASGPDGADTPSAQGLQQQSPGGPPVRIVADAALTAGLEALESGYKAVHAGGWQLALQERGEMLAAIGPDKSDSAADSAPQVYILADTELLESLRSAKRIDEASLRTFAGDRIVIASRAEETWLPASVFDLGDLRFTALGLGDPQATAVGLYARQALVSDGAYVGLEPRLKPYSSTAGLLSALTSVKDRKVREAERGEIQLAVLFASLAAQTQGVKVVYAVGADLHEPVRYQAVAAAGHAGDPGVFELLRYLAEDPAVQARLESYGYLSRQAALAPPADPGLAPAGSK